MKPQKGKKNTYPYYEPLWSMNICLNSLSNNQNMYQKNTILHFNESINYKKEEEKKPYRSSETAQCYT